MDDTPQAVETIRDYISGKSIADIGTETQRQAVARYLVQRRGFYKSDLKRDAQIVLTFSGEYYRSYIDLVIHLDEKPVLAVKCAAGSMGSWQREILSAARLLAAYQLPWAVVSDGCDAIVLDTVSGEVVGTGLDAIPTRQKVQTWLQAGDFSVYPPQRREREKIIFRSYDSMRVNVRRPPGSK